MKPFLDVLTEAAVAKAETHLSDAEAHKHSASEHAPGSAEFHRSMAKHHHSMMMAARATASGKWKIADRHVHVKDADAHFAKSLSHHKEADSK